MLSIRRESLLISDSDVREPLDPSVEVVKACVPDGARKLRVLVVDDNRDAADSLSKLVNLWGHDVRAAYDGVEALEMTLVQQPDVMLLDLAMPKMDGCQVARRLRQHTAFANTLLIAITGWTGSAHRRLCDETGFDYYFIKPIDPAHLRLLLQCERRWLAWSAEESEQTKAAGRLEDEFRTEVPALEER